MYLYLFYKSKLFSFHWDSDLSAPMVIKGNGMVMEDDPNIRGLEMFSLQGGKAYSPRCGEKIGQRRRTQSRPAASPTLK